MNAIRHVILGLFFFITLAVLGVVTIYLGDFTPIRDTTPLVAWFEEVDGLGSGDPVFVYGVPSGRVTEVAFAPDDPPPGKRLRVSFTIDHPVTLHQGYQIRIGNPSLLGGKELDVTTGDGPLLTPAEYADLRGKADANLARQISAVFGDNRQDVRRIVGGLANLVSDLDQGKRSLASIALEKKTHEDLNAAIAAGRSLLAKADSGDGSIGRALNSPELHDRLVGFLKNGEVLFGDAREKPGVLHALVYDEEMARKLKEGVEGLAETAARVGRGEGLLGKITVADSEETWRDFRDLAAKFSGIGTDLGVLIDGARRGRGVLGLLMSDDQARRTVERIFDQVARAIEDAREAAPVSSVASFLFGQL